jgi:hypothetical protein
VEEVWPHAAEPCDGTPWWRGRVNDDGEAVAVPLARTSWRGRQGEAHGAGELAREGWKEGCPRPRSDAALSARWREKRQIGAW